MLKWQNACDAIRLGCPVFWGQAGRGSLGMSPEHPALPWGCQVPDAAQPQPPHTALTSLAALPLPTLYYS